MLVRHILLPIFGLNQGLFGVGTLYKLALKLRFRNPWVMSHRVCPVLFVHSVCTTQQSEFVMGQSSITRHANSLVQHYQWYLAQLSRRVLPVWSEVVLQHRVALSLFPAAW